MRSDDEIRSRIAATTAYSCQLDEDDFERLQLEQQVELLLWVLGEIATEDLPEV